MLASSRTEYNNTKKSQTSMAVAEADRRSGVGQRSTFPTADRIVIIAKDWFMQKGGKVPSDVCLKVNAFLNNYKIP